MTMMDYLRQRAAPWVSITVLAGGLATALILFFIVRVEENAQFLAVPNEIKVQTPELFPRRNSVQSISLLPAGMMRVGKKVPSLISASLIIILISLPFLFLKIVKVPGHPK